MKCSVLCSILLQKKLGLKYAVNKKISIMSHKNKLFQFILPYTDDFQKIFKIETSRSLHKTF